MKPNIILNDELVSAAFKYAENIHTKRELVEVILTEFATSLC